MLELEDLKEIKKYIDNKFKQTNYPLRLATVKYFNPKTKRMRIQLHNSNTIIEKVMTLYPKANYETGTFFVPEIGDTILVVNLDGTWVSLGSLSEEFNLARIDTKYLVLDKEKIYYKIKDGSIVFEIADGIKLTLSENRLTINKELQANEIHSKDYYSSTDTKGKTEDVVIVEDGGSTKTLHFENGLYISTS